MPAVGDERIPPAGTPSLGDTVALDNQMQDAMAAQMFAHRDAGLPSADDECFHFFD